MTIFRPKKAFSATNQKLLQYRCIGREINLLRLMWNWILKIYLLVQHVWEINRLWDIVQIPIYSDSISLHLWLWLKTRMILISHQNVKLAHTFWTCLILKWFYCILKWKGLGMRLFFWSYMKLFWILKT